MNKNKCGVHFCPNCGFYSSVNFILKEHLEKCGVTDADYEALNKAKFNIGDIVFEKKYGSFYEILSTYIKYNEHTGKNQFVYVYETVFDYNVYETVSHWMPEKGLELYMSKRDL